MEIQLYKNSIFGGVRFAEDEKTGKVLLCGIDVAKALGFSDVKQALQKNVRRDTKLIPTKTEGGVQNLKYIQEGDVYRLIVHSRLKEAEKFEEWVFDEVLPSIRQHGYYISKDAQDRAEAIDLVLSGYDELRPEKAKILKREFIQGLKDQNKVLMGENRQLKRSLRISEDRASDLEHQLKTVQSELLEQAIKCEPRELDD